MDVYHRDAKAHSVGRETGSYGQEIVDVGHQRTKARSLRLLTHVSTLTRRMPNLVHYQGPSSLACHRESLVQISGTHLASLILSVSDPVLGAGLPPGWRQNVTGSHDSGGRSYLTLTASGTPQSPDSHLEVGVWVRQPRRRGWTRWESSNCLSDQLLNLEDPWPDRP